MTKYKRREYITTFAVRKTRNKEEALLVKTKSRTPPLFILMSKKQVKIMPKVRKVAHLIEVTFEGKGPHYVDLHDEDYPGIPVCDCPD